MNRLCKFSKFYGGFVNITKVDELDNAFPSRYCVENPEGMEILRTHHNSKETKSLSLINPQLLR
jgi:hypothetical protein